MSGCRGEGIVASLLILIAAAGIASADTRESVGNLGDAKRWSFEGIQSFSADELRAALVSDMPVAVAAHPLASRDIFLQTLAQRAREGLRHHGFGDAVVRAELKDQGKSILVSIAEGPQRLCGDVRVFGDSAIDVRRLAEWLTSAQPPADAIHDVEDGADLGQPSAWRDLAGTEVELAEPVWRVGAPARFDAASHERLKLSVQRALLELGRVASDISLSVESVDEGKAELHIDLSDPSRPITIGDLVVRDTERHSETELLDWLGVSSGQPFTLARRREWARRLWLSGRFETIEIDTNLAPERSVMNLTFNLRELQSAPKLSEPLTREDQAVLAVRRQTTTLRDRGESLVFRLDSATHRIEFLSSSEGQMVRIGTVSEKDQVSWKAFIDQDGDHFEVFAVDSRRRLLVPWPAVRADGKFGIALRETKANREVVYSLTANLGYKHGPEIGADDAGFFTKLSISPATCLSLVRDNDAAYQWNESELTVKTSKSEMRVDTMSNRLELFRFLTLTEDADNVTLAVESGAMEAARRDLSTLTDNIPNQFDSQSPISSTLSFLCHADLFTLLTSLTKGKGMNADRMRSNLELFRSLIDAGAFSQLDKHMSTTAPSRKGVRQFSIPSEFADRIPRNFTQQMVMNAGLPVSDWLLPRESWAWMVWRETCLVLCGETTQTKSQLKELYESPELGPLACEVLVWLTSRMSWQPLPELFAMKGLRRLDTPAFLSDCDCLLNSNSWVGSALVGVVGATSKLNDEHTKQLGELIGINGDTFLISVRPLRDVAAEPREQAVREVLASLWESAWREKVAARLSARLSPR
ncbi:MAG: hypothetical protein KDA59_03400 [Planctomycetales bacterium]|nr:hypothetical protein [Planctomycetales bacterium]